MTPNYWPTTKLISKDSPNVYQDAVLIVAEDEDQAQWYYEMLKHLGLIPPIAVYLFIDYLDEYTWEGELHGFFVGNWQNHRHYWQVTQILRMLKNPYIDKILNND